jgi:hypothetical protein
MSYFDEHPGGYHDESKTPFSGEDSHSTEKKIGFTTLRERDDTISTSYSEDPTKAPLSTTRTIQEKCSGNGVSPRSPNKPHITTDNIVTNIHPDQVATDGASEGNEGVEGTEAIRSKLQCSYRECRMKVFTNALELSHHYDTHPKEHLGYSRSVTGYSHAEKEGGFEDIDEILNYMRKMRRGDDSYSAPRPSTSRPRPFLPNHSSTKVLGTIETEKTDQMDTAFTDIVQQEPYISSSYRTSSPLLVIETHAESHDPFVSDVQIFHATSEQIEEHTLHQSDLEMDSSDTTYESSDACDFDLVHNIEAQKLQIVDRLIVCVYDMFSVRGSPTEHGYPSSNTDGTRNDTSDSAAKERKKTKRKSDHGKRSGEDEGDDDEYDDSKRRRKSGGSSSKLHQDPKKKLACPYYRHDPHAWNKHRACRGPGFDTVHRIKYVYGFYLVYHDG